jgi:competence protein ComEA
MDNETRKPRSLWRRVFGRSAQSTTDERIDRPPSLAPSDQLAVAVLCAVALLFLTMRWLGSGGPGGGLVDIEAAEPLEATFQTDINTADWTELAQLPEIGEALAQRIVEWRERYGAFTSPDDLDRVPGIGPKILEKVRPYVVVR